MLLIYRYYLYLYLTYIPNIIINLRAFITEHEYSTGTGNGEIQCFIGMYTKKS